MISFVPAVLGLVAVATFSFKGGSEHDLAVALSKHLGVPVVIRSESLTNIEPIEVTYQEIDGLRRTILGATGLQSHLEVDDKGTEPTHDDARKWLAVYRDFYDSSFTTLNGQFRRFPDEHDAFVLKSKVLDFNVPSGKYFSFRSDEEFANGELTVFPLYVRPFLVGHGTFTTRRDFLDATAKALGASVIESGGKPSIDFDYSTFREFVRRRPEDFPAVSGNKEDAAYDIASRRFAKECYLTLSEQQLRDGYQQPGKVLEIAIADKSRLHALTLERIQTLNARQIAKQVSDYLLNVNMEDDFRFSFSGSGGCGTRLRGLNGKPDFGF